MAVTYPPFPTYPATTLQESIDIFEVAADQIHNFVNGSDTDEVTAENGNIPSIRKIRKDLFETVGNVRKFNSVSDMQTSANAAELTTGQIVETVGYFGTYIGTVNPPKGGNHYELVDAGSAGARPAEDGGSVIHVTGGSGGLYLKGLFLDGVYNVTQWGADPTGVSSAVNAISSAWNYITDPNIQRFASETGEASYFATNGPRLRFPSGRYLWDTNTGLNLAAGQSFIFNLEGDGAENTSIVNTGTGYFIDSEYNPTGFGIKGIKFFGGKGAIRLKSTDVNVTRFVKVVDNVFSGYTECAIQSNSQDYPYWRITNNQFRGAELTDTICVALSGLSAGSVIQSNAFILYKYALKLAPSVIAGNDVGPTTPLNIVQNDFFRDANGPTNMYPVWLVPNQDTANNAGRAIVFSLNKFGNENLSVGDAQILVALEAAGSFVGDKQHTTTPSGFISGVSFLKNNVNCEGNGNHIPFIYSYTSRLFNLEINDIYDNNFPTFVVEYDAAVTLANNQQGSRTNLIRLGQCLAAQEGEPLNAVVSAFEGNFIIDDPFGYASSLIDSTPSAMVSDYCEYVDILNETTTSNWASVNVTKTSINNCIGLSSEAVEVTLTASDGRIVGDLDVTGVEPGALCWIEMDIQQGSSNSASSISIEVNDGGRVDAKRVYSLPTIWKRIRFPWTSRSTAGTWNIKISVPDAVGTEKFKVGRAAAYQSSVPVNYDHLRTVNKSGGGMWNAQHLVLDTYHLWVDSTGDFRIKNGAPTSDTDGVVVGTQT